MPTGPLEVIRTAAQHFRRNRFDAYEPIRPLLAFHQSRHPRRLIRKPNQVGGSYACCWEAWAHLIGRHPYQPGVRPSSGRIMLASMEKQYPRISEVLFDLAPMDALDPACTYTKGKGWYTNGRRLIRARNGHTIDFSSGEGSILSHASAALDWLYIDEGPKEAHFGEALSRVAYSQGPVWMNFTPIGRPLDYLKRHVEGDPERGEPPREDWVQFRPRLVPEDCTTLSGRCLRSAESIEMQVAAYGPWEYEQRVNGEWEGITSGRRFVGFNEHCIVDDDELPEEVNAVRMGLDHGESAGAQHISLLVVTLPGPRYYLVREHVGVAGQTPTETAQAAIDILADVGMTPFHLAGIGPPPSGCYGDVNSAGLLGAGGKYNDFLERALAQLLRLSSCPFPIDIPGKGRGSVSAGEAALNHAMKEGRFFVHVSCKPFIHAARHYTGREQDLKHRIDGARYAIADLLLATPTARNVMVLK